MWPQIWQGDKIEYFSIVFFSLKHLIFSTSALTASSMMTKTSSSFTAQGAAYAGDHTIDILNVSLQGNYPYLSGLADAKTTSIATPATCAYLTTSTRSHS